MNPSRTCRAIALAAVFLGARVVLPQDAATAPPADAQAAADSIAKEIEQIRGLTFKQPVHVENQSIEDFSKYVSREMDEAVPQPLQKHYGAIVRTLGLYRGPPIEDFSGLMKTVLTSQVGAYYDPQKRSFFVLMANMPDMALGVMYSHELYHALQDQYFDLVKYIDGDRSEGKRRNADQHLARSAVVEGEASYMMSLWMLQKMTGKPPARDMMATVVSMQANMSMDKLREMMKQPEVAKMMGDDMKGAVDSAANIPDFIMDTMIGVYLRGMSFVFAVHEQGWPAVEKLYTEYPPQSTEQILHPEKWQAREAPVDFAWPKLDKAKALRDWELLDDDVLGEFQWRSIIKEQGFPAEAESVAAGWGGDRYAVFKRKDSDAMLLLLRTSWDSEAEAREFADVYGRVQAAKYGDAKVPVRLEQKGVDVFIVEGGDAASTDALLKIVKGAKVKRA